MRDDCKRAEEIENQKKQEINRRAQEGSFRRISNALPPRTDAQGGVS